MRDFFLLLSVSGLVLVSLPSCGGDDVDPSCSSWCAVVEECTDTSFSECTQACAAELRNAATVSPQCIDAVKGQNVCVGQLTCNEFESWRTDTPPDAYPCKSADDAVVSACAP